MSSNPRPGPSTRVGYLGPEGTFSEEALLASARADSVQPVALETIREAVMAVQEGLVQWAVVPIENSIEGTVTVTLDTLTGEAQDVSIVGEVVVPVRHYLVSCASVELDRIATVVSHPHVPGQCTRFLHEQLPSARFSAATSTAEAVRMVADRQDPAYAAIGTRLAAEIYGCTILREGIQDNEDNQTRFVWLGHSGDTLARPGDTLARPGDTQGHSGDTLGRPGDTLGHSGDTIARPGDTLGRPGDALGRPGDAMGRPNDAPALVPPLQGPHTPDKTSIVFWGPGADRAGWLVLCLDEFGRREINLTKIESRPRREQLGHYMFFVDLQGSLEDRPVAEALAGLDSLCEHVRVLGSYPRAGSEL